MWIFGYGSLMWRPDFPYEKKIYGSIKGFSRKFWQQSIIYRGTPAHPGRCVTIVAEEGAVSYGVAYKISQDKQEEVRQKLDAREKRLYQKTVDFQPRCLDDQEETIKALVYYGDETNVGFHPASDEEIAKVIVSSRGLGGTNIDYLLNLTSYLREHFPEDDDKHLFTLEKLVLNLRNEGIKC